mmetsp:Transcript_23459/g.26742  ORF Transcript_23459/g.26742 Transcript_23459/m.26742 type:complete len:477 (+) Transcript_23459:1526-2956(+)
MVSYKNERQLVTMPTGYDAVFKLRCSDGLEVKNYLNSGSILDDGITSSPAIELPCVYPNTCFAVELGYKIGGIPYDLDQYGRRVEKIDPMAYFQSALLYTDSFGRRRVRVTTLGLRTSKSVSSIFNACDFGVLTTLLTRQAMNKLLQDGIEGAALHHARNDILNSCVKTMFNYRKYAGGGASRFNNCPTPISTGRTPWNIPESLKFLPLFCLSLRKSKMFCASMSRDSLQSTTKPSPSADERAYRLFHGSSNNPTTSMLCVHPTLVRIDNMHPSSGEILHPTIDYGNNQYHHQSVYGNVEHDEACLKSSLCPYVHMPNPIPPTVASLTDDGIFILDDGFSIYLFIGKDVNEEARKDLLNVDYDTSLLSTSSEMYNISQQQKCNSISISTSSDLGRKVMNIISQSRVYSSMTDSIMQRPTVAPLVVVIGRGGYEHRGELDVMLENEMIDNLVEDSSTKDKSYADFWMAIEQRIKNFS